MLHWLADLLEQSLEELTQAESKDQGEGPLCQPFPFQSSQLSLLQSPVLSAAVS